MYRHSGAVIPAKPVPAYFKRGVGIQLRKTGFRVTPGMTIKIIKLGKPVTRNQRVKGRPLRERDRGENVGNERSRET
jgi:hypothetical protein